MHNMTDDFIKSKEFLSTYEWRKVRQEVLVKYNARCMCCGKTASDSIVLNVDHIKPRKTHPELALSVDNLQILCNICNHGKSNWHTEDFREDKTFIITKSWIDSHRTPKGGITGVQLKALGLPIKPKKGWMKAIVGTRISEENRIAFEEGKYIKATEAKELKEKLRSAKSKLTVDSMLTKGMIEGCAARKRAERAKLRYIRNNSADMLDQIIDTASADLLSVYLEVFKEFSEVVYILNKLRSYDNT